MLLDRVSGLGGVVFFHLPLVADSSVNQVDVAGPGAAGDDPKLHHIDPEKVIEELTAAKKLAILMGRVLILIVAS